MEKSRQTLEETRDIPTAAVEVRKSRNLVVDTLKRLVREKPLGTVGAIIVLVLLFTGVFADFLAPYEFTDQSLFDRLQPSSAQHLLGTDHLGRDVLSRVIYGARISMYVCLAGSVICAVSGTVIGLISGFFGGKADMIIQRFVDAFMCFPPIFLYLMVMSLLGQGLWQVILVLGFIRGIHQSRIIRSTVISIKGNVYVDAANAIGCSNLRMIRKHIFPNVLAPIITVTVVSSGYMILGEAMLSFLGFGMPPDQPSWGTMLAGPGRTYLLKAPWLALWPGLALAISVYGLNIFGDAIRDLLDPRLRGGLGRYSGVKRKRAKKYRQEGQKV
jgi:peptide/nickel transport system permease protein